MHLSVKNFADHSPNFSPSPFFSRNKKKETVSRDEQRKETREEIIPSSGTAAKKKKFESISSSSSFSSDPPPPRFCYTRRAKGVSKAPLGASSRVATRLVPAPLYANLQLWLQTRALYTEAYRCRAGRVCARPGALWRVEPRPLCRRRGEEGRGTRPGAVWKRLAARQHRADERAPPCGRRWHNHLAEIRGAPGRPRPPCYERVCGRPGPGYNAMDHLAKGELSSFDSGRGLWGEGGGEGFYLKGEGRGRGLLVFRGFFRERRKEGRKACGRGVERR